jgi:hypothetical protein
VDEGFFKKKKTGLGENIRKVKEAKKELRSIKPTTSPRKQREILSKAFDAYSGFGIFVGSRLRGMSRDPHWQRYCDLASDEVVARMAEMQHALAALGNAG